MSGNLSSTSSPQVKGSKHNPPNIGGGSSSGSGSPSTSAYFTPEMRSRQARGKDPYRSDSEDEEWFLGQNVNEDGSISVISAPPRRSVPIRDSTFTANERRRLAAQVLNNSELLAMAAIRDDESIPSTRLRYTRLLCGLEESNNNTNNSNSNNPQTRSSSASASGHPSGSTTPLGKRSQRRA